jgi:3-deoxy-D-manno-octulosonic-acid transferase
LIKRDAQILEMNIGFRSNGPIIWAHAGSQTAIDVMRDVMSRIKLIESSVTYVLTAPLTAETEANDIKILQDSEAQSNIDFLTKCSPDLCLWTDESISSPLFLLINRFSIPVILVNANIAMLPSRTWIWRKTAARQTVRSVSFALVETAEDASNLRSFGLSHKSMAVLGPLNAGIVPPNCDDTERDHIAEVLMSRPTWFAQGVPKQELELVLEAFILAQRSAHRMLLILDTPSVDPNEVKALCKTYKLNVSTRFEEGEPDASTQVFLTDDKVFEDGLWYRLAALSYMGGSFSDGNVSNPMIAAALGSAIIHGPVLGAFSNAYIRLRLNGATRQIDNEAMFAQALGKLIAPDECAELASNGWGVVSEGAGAIDQIVEVSLQRLGFGD